MKKPGVLLVTTSPLLPANSGGRIYTWGTTAPLAGEFDYHLVAVATDAELAEFESDEAALSARYREVFASFRLLPRPPIPAVMDRRRVLAHLLFHTRHRLPFMDVSYYSPQVVATVRELVASGVVDVIEVDHAQMGYVRRFVPSVPAILVNHNIESDLHPFWMTERWSGAEWLVWRAFAAVSRANSRRIEIGNGFGFAAKVFVSARDLDRVDDAVPKLLVPVPVTADPDPRTAPTGGDLTLLWVGGFDWAPNAEAMRWFLTAVWNRLADAPMRLHVVGGSPPADIVAAADGRTTVHGHVDDLTGLRRAADVFVAPLLSGSGVRVKVVEAMAAGLPVVATGKGVEGLAVVAGRHFLLADTADDFAAALRRLASSPQLRDELAAHAVDHVRRHHDPASAAAVKAEALRLAMSAQPRR